VPVLRIFRSSSSKIGIFFYLSFDFILNIIMLLFIMFLVYSSSTFDMVMIDNEFMYIYLQSF